MQGYRGTLSVRYMPERLLITAYSVTILNPRTSGCGAGVTGFTASQLGGGGMIGWPKQDIMYNIESLFNRK